jgi:uncharacterized protein YlaN (UPF0358 family)
MVLALMVALAGVGVVGAQEGGQGGQGGPGGFGHGGGRGDGAGRPGIAHEVVEIVADATGLTGREIVAQVQDGSTLAEVITANGGDVQAVTDALIAAVTEQVNTAVANGRITQERADEILENLPTRIDEVFNGEFEFGGRGGDFGGRGQGLRGAGALLQAASDAIGLDVREIATQLRDGASLADVITANGGSPDEVLASALAAVTERINQAVAEGRITQEQADERLATLEANLSALLNGEYLADQGVGV